MYAPTDSGESCGPVGLDAEPSAFMLAPVDPALVNTTSKSNGGATVHPLHAGVIEDGQFLDRDDKSDGTYLASGLVSPFHTCAAVPFSAEDVVAVITDSTVPTNTLNLSPYESPSITPLDFAASGNSPAFSQESPMPRRGEWLAKGNPVRPGCASAALDKMQRVIQAHYERQRSAFEQSVTQPPNSSMLSLSTRLSLPSVSESQAQSPSPGVGMCPTVVEQDCSRLGNRLGSGCCTGAASSFTLNTGGFLSGAGGPSACLSLVGSAELSSSSANACAQGERTGQGICFEATLRALDPAAVGDSSCSGFSGRSLEPQISLGARVAACPGLDSTSAARGTPKLLVVAPGLSGMGSTDLSPSATKQTHPDSLLLSNNEPSPAENFLRFTDLEACWADMRDLSFIGSGAGGLVYSGTWCGMPMAVKFMLSGDADLLHRQQREAALSRLASHPHLVQTYAVAAAQLKPSHFQHDTPTHRASGLSQPDLLATAAAGSMTAVELYGTTVSMSPSFSIPVVRQCFSNTVAAGAAAGLSGTGSAPANVVAAGRPGPQLSASNLTAGNSPDANGRTHSVEFDFSKALGAMQGAGPGSRQHPAGSAAGGLPSLAGTTEPRVSRIRSQLQQMQQRRFSSSAVTGATQPSGASCAGGACRATDCGAEKGATLGSVSPVGPHVVQSPAGSNDAFQSLATTAHSPRGASSAVSPRAEHKTRMQGHTDPTFATNASVISAVDLQDPHELQVEGQADSFVMTASEGHCGLMVFQPADVLAHLGGKPDQWLTIVIMEEMDRGSLHNSIHHGIFHPTNSHLAKRHRVRAIVRTLLEVAQGMAHLHSAGLVHGDLKPANVLLKSNSRDLRGFMAKVSDFGVTRAMAEGTSQATVSASDWGTVVYTAPEVFNGKYGPASDVFSFGVLTWHLTTGQVPHEDVNPFAVMLAVSRGELELEWPPSVPRPLRKLGRLCMQFDATARPTFAQIARALIRLEGKMRNYSKGSNPAA